MARPPHHKTPTNVGIQMVIYGLEKVDNMESKTTFSCSLRYYWNDPRLSWDPDEYDGIKHTSLFADPGSERDYIWMPDIESYQNANPTLYSELRRGMA